MWKRGTTYLLWIKVQSDTPTMKKSKGFSQKMKIQLPYNPEIQPPSMPLRDITSTCYRDTCAPLFLQLWSQSPRHGVHLGQWINDNENLLFKNASEKKLVEIEIR